MNDLAAILTANRAAVDELAAAASAAAAVWTTPRAPGKWSPSQVVEHVARALEESANVVAGVPSKLPSVPRPFRPLLRIFFNRVVKQGRFPQTPRARTSRGLDPATGPDTPAAARLRLEEALAKFDRECRACAARGGKVPSPAFGAIAVEDYATFQAIHTRHHCRQIPGS